MYMKCACIARVCYVCIHTHVCGIYIYIRINVCINVYIYIYIIIIINVVQEFAEKCSEQARMMFSKYRDVARSVEDRSRILKKVSDCRTRCAYTDLFEQDTHVGIVIVLYVFGNPP